MSTFSELVRAIVARILQDKIILGLVIVGILGIFVGGFATSDEAPDSVKRLQKQAPRNLLLPVMMPKTPQKLDPPLATDFVKWWMSGAMDYSPSSAAKNHEASFHWMTPQACAILPNLTLDTGCCQRCRSGTHCCGLLPVSVQAQA